MSGFGDSIGTVIEGGLFGRAVEPGAGETAGHPAGPVTCANCGTSYQGHFCPQCGQKAHIHRSLAAIGHDIMHGVLHLDGKLWATLPLLAFKPGELTRRYVVGERAKFVSPMAMFLFTVFAMFAVFQMVGIGAPTDLAAEALLPEQMAETRDRLKQDVSSLEKDLAAAQRSGEDVEATQADLAKAKIDLKAYEDARTIVLDKETGTSFTFTKTGVGLIDGMITKWRKNPGLMLYKLQANGYKFSWLLIPLSLPFMWLIFAWRRQIKMYDHAVFVTYSLSFMSLLFIVMSIIGAIPDGAGWTFLLFVVGAPLHLYKQLRHAYGLRRFSAFWRWCVLLVCTQIVLALFLQLLLLIGAF
jgi:hypothetical protein